MRRKSKMEQQQQQNEPVSTPSKTQALRHQQPQQQQQQQTIVPPSDSSMDANGSKNEKQDQPVKINDDRVYVATVADIDDVKHPWITIDNPRFIGHGGHGTVYEIGPNMCLKLVQIHQNPRYVGNDGEIYERFDDTSREWDNMMKLRTSQYVIKLFGFSLGTKYCGLYMPLYKCTLTSIIDDGGYDGKRALAYVYQLASALYHCHSKQIMHRDVTPTNIFLDDTKKKLVLGDFGSSKRYLTAERQHTIPMTSLWYRAPELMINIENGELHPSTSCYTKYTEKIDCWSFGCVAWEVFKRTPLFPYGDEKEVTDRQKIVASVVFGDHRVRENIGDTTNSNNNPATPDAGGSTAADNIHDELLHSAPKPEYITYLLKKICKLNQAERISFKAIHRDVESAMKTFEVPKDF